MNLFTYVIFSILLLLLLIRCSYSSQQTVHKHTQSGLIDRKTVLSWEFRKTNMLSFC